MKKPCITFTNYVLNRVNEKFIEDFTSRFEQDWKNRNTYSMTSSDYDPILTDIYQKCVNEYKEKYGKDIDLPTMTINYKDKPKKKSFWKWLFGSNVKQTKKKEPVFDDQFFEDMEMGVFDDDLD